MQKLIDVPIRTRVRVAHVNTHPEMSVRLLEMGFCENAVIRCVNKGSGNIVYKISNSRIRLSAQVAGNSYVSTVE